MSEIEDQSIRLKRSYKILHRKFLQYLLPTMITTMALSLNEFADSMMVANLLGMEAMGIVTLGFPVMLLMAAIYTLFGTGGSTLYAICLGERQTERAGKVLCISLIASLCCGILILFAGLLQPEFFLSLLCHDANLSAGFAEYFRVLVLSAPFITPLLTLVAFLPPSGAPALATAVNLTANAVNLLMDYVYIRYFGMGPEGAAWATLTGYLAGNLLIPLIFLRGEARLRFAGIRLQDIGLLRKCIGTGGAAAASQLGFAVKFAVCNVLAASLGGSAGVVAFAFCLQALSIVSVFNAGISGAAMPLLSVLHGQRDFSGRGFILKKALLLQSVIVLVFVVWFEIAPYQAAAIYDITDPATLSLATHGLRIFAVSIFLRGLCITFMYYLQVLQEKRYAMAVSLFDGLVGIVPMAWLLCELLGMEGLWWTYLLNSVLLLLGMLIWNRRLAVQPGSHYTDMMLSEYDDVPDAVWDFSTTGTAKDISSVSLELSAIAERNGLSHDNSLMLGLAVEEMAVYTARHDHEQTLIDILARMYADRIEIDFRSTGKSFSPLVDSEDDDMINLRLLRNLAKKLEYDYIMGMNSTRITLELR